ncbi:hypothetical protein LEP1GSC132_4135 [Leptospira kirschneri str. 200803703]|uniref:Uncharacterized protein n=1 Tax=Leptospira kirschneri str. H1 TaxID=1049966 RepID=A0A0E2BF33_9LEPT|nr:hypothetical protein LEP1GSC081_3333 [Leptospira kirschneri str. H1]EKO60542.1 hypothetical protein LEP1GSC082_3440 [Leptospira kirschneri str. H2]EMO68586.1 hypothetical protein LEP1GSC132_4135 [Leptospira kirschneri str. 200803703]
MDDFRKIQKFSKIVSDPKLLVFCVRSHILSFKNRLKNRIIFMFSSSKVISF